jgi:tripartite-type tricarboxylate transporter receptor subunit TctC
VNRVRRAAARTLPCLAFALACALQSSAGQAQTWPAKPVRLVVGTQVSTPIDILSRVIAESLGGILGQPVVVENRPGATGMIAAQEVLRQPADGYTLMTLFMPMTVGQTIYRNVPYDLRRDFTAIGQTVWSYNVLVVHPSVSATNARELVALLRANPGKYSFASGGAGSPAHIAGELLKQQTRTDALHVPYVQFPQGIADLLGGQIQFMFGATPPLVGHIASGKVRALAVTGPQRIAALKDVPTMAEAGFPDFVIRDWQGLIARAGTPKEVVDKVNAGIAKAMTTDAVKTALARLGADAAAGTPGDFATLIGGEVERWAGVAKAAGIKVEF